MTIDKTITGDNEVSQQMYLAGYNAAKKEFKGVLENVKAFIEHWNIKLDESVGLEDALKRMGE